MQLGIGQVVITPPIGINLAGYGHRNHGAEAVMHELEARVFCFADTETAQTAYLICADIIGFDDALTQSVRTELQKQLGIAPETVMLAASHTHSGPQTAETLLRAGGPVDPAYVANLRQKLVTAALAARSNMQEVTLSVGTTALTGYSINRRRLVNGKMAMAPNPYGVRDDEVTVLVFTNVQSGQAAAVLFNFACHPTVLSGYNISADYPGAARRYIEQAMPGVAAGFLQGCCGDIRPNCTLVGAMSFRPGTQQEAELFGNALGASVTEAMQGQLQVRRGQVRTFASQAELTYSESDEKTTLWLYRLDLAAELSLLGMGGEVCCEYGLFTKNLQMGRKIIPVAYANGLVGYIPPARYFAEGGYEPIASAKAYSLPSTFSPTIEVKIKNAVMELISRQ